MTACVLIVEDEPLIALSVEETLRGAGYEVCGVAATQTEALSLVEGFHPDFAIVDVSLNPGDGRVVAKELCRRYGTAVLFATALEHEVRGLKDSGAVACLAKPYEAEDVPKALVAVDRIRRGVPPGLLPDHMITLPA